MKNNIKLRTLFWNKYKGTFFYILILLFAFAGGFVLIQLNIPALLGFPQQSTHPMHFVATLMMSTITFAIGITLIVLLFYILFLIVQIIVDAIKVAHRSYHAINNIPYKLQDIKMLQETDCPTLRAFIIFCATKYQETLGKHETSFSAFHLPDKYWEELIYNLPTVYPDDFSDNVQAEKNKMTIFKTALKHYIEDGTHYTFFMMVDPRIGQKKQREELPSVYIK